MLQQDGRQEALTGLSRFRGAFYDSLSGRQDALFELADALLCTDGPVRTLVDLALAPEHCRGHGALYGGLNKGRLDVDRLQRTIAGTPLPRAAGGRLVLAVDVSPWLRPDVGGFGHRVGDSWPAVAADEVVVGLAGETLRASLETLACAAPDWLAKAVHVREWADRYGPRTNSWHPPASKAKREEMALGYGRDGFTLLEAVHAPHTPVWLRELPALRVLRSVWLQNYHRTVTETGPEVTRRESGDLPPGRLRLASPYDTDARYGLKQRSRWTGCKVHISETCDEADDQSAAVDYGAVHGPDGPPPRIITNIATTDATVTDAEMADPIHHMLATRDLLPAEHYLDSGYPSAELIVGVKKRFGVALITRSC